MNTTQPEPTSTLAFANFADLQEASFILQDGPEPFTADLSALTLTIQDFAGYYASYTTVQDFLQDSSIRPISVTYSA